MEHLSIAVLISCFNEAFTIAKVIQDFQKELPKSVIYMYDNNSTDDTFQISAQSGAVVKKEHRQGKGNVIRSMFREVEADLYLLVDGDDTYPAEACHELIRCVGSGLADMAVGDRLSNKSYHKANERAFHRFGNHLVKSMINRLFGGTLNDITSGYRCLNRKFAKAIPIKSTGFEIESEMTIHALTNQFLIKEIPIQYRGRPEGSSSKFRTYSDGFRILYTILMLYYNMLCHKQKANKDESSSEEGRCK